MTIWKAYLTKAMRTQAGLRPGTLVTLDPIGQGVPAENAPTFAVCKPPCEAVERMNADGNPKVGTRRGWRSVPLAWLVPIASDATWVAPRVGEMPS